MCPSQHAELHEILYDAANKAGVHLRYKCTVTNVDPSTHKVTLSSGEVLSPDVVVGADGEHGLCRRTLTEQQDHGTPTGLVMYE